MTTLCATCGFDNPAGMRFCGNCGSRLADLLVSKPADILAGVETTGVNPPGFSSQSLGVMIGSDIAEKLRKAGIEASGQRRKVTVLFADLSGYTSLSERIDPEDLYDLIQQFVRLLVDDVYQYEGIVDKLTGDGLMALFGAPISHENNAERAVRAALDMQADILKLSLELRDKLNADIQMRIGLHSGTVIVGGIGSNLLMDYTAIGDTVNLARRIEEAASPGAILVSEPVFRQIRPLFDCQQTSMLNPKGIGHPVNAYQVLGPKANPGLVRGIEGLRAPMIGRDQELEQLKQAVKALASRKQGRFGLITGEAGLGKSRLTTEFKALLGQYPVHVLEGQSQAYRRSISYWVFQDLFYHYLEVNPYMSQSLVRERLIQKAYQALGGQAGEALPYLEHLLSLPYSDPAAAERLSYLDGVQLRQQILLAVRDLLVAESGRRPLLLILEDLHWADEASLDLLRFLVESLRQAPIFILAISRQILEGTMSKMVDWAGQYLGEAFFVHKLQTLSLDQSERLLTQLLMAPDLPHDLRELILQRAAGIPFYLEEILRMLIDEGAIQREGDQWRLAEGTEDFFKGVPETLQGLILARFDRLNPAQRRVLQVASVIGKNFSMPVLEAVLQSEGYSGVHSLLASLLEREFILPLQAGLDPEYTFRHILMSDAIYDTLLRKERSRLHGQVGKAIEELYADRLDEQVELLARHYSWSPMLDRALHYLILAGQKEARSYVNAQAQQHFEQALSLLAQVDHTLLQELQVRAGLGDIFVLIGEYSRAREQYQAALGCILTQSSYSWPKECSDLYRKIGTTYERQGEYDEALSHLAEAQHILEDVKSNLPVEWAQTLNDIGWIHFRRGNLEEAEKRLTEALVLLEGTTRYDVTASIYNRLGGVYFQKEQLDQASNFVRKSLVLREEIGDIVAVARSYNNLGLLGWKKGDWDNALENFRRSVKLHANLGDIEGTIQLHSNIGLLLTDKGDLEEARSHLEESLNAALQIGHSFMEGLAYHHLTRYWLAASDWKQSLEYSKRALSVFNEIGSQENLVDLFASIGEAWLGLGDLEQARKAGETSLKLLEESGNSPAVLLPEHGRILRLLGNIALLEGKWDLANRQLKESAMHFTRLANQLELGRTLVALAILAQSRNDRTAFRLHLNEARLIFLQLGAKIDLQALSRFNL